MFEDLIDNIINESIDWFDYLKVKIRENPKVLIVLLIILAIILMPIINWIFTLIFVVGLAYFLIMRWAR
ncbi:MAG: hypothetical protein E7Z84_05335 [Methanosphaera stadtmanae]|nr:hypothetical protein [Methanosphaera stadtmanae]